MASGNAIVATDVGQTWRIVDGAVGRRVPPHPQAIAGAVGGLLEDGAMARRLGEGARERVLARYGPDPYVSRLLEVYELARRRRAGQIV